MGDLEGWTGLHGASL